MVDGGIGLQEVLPPRRVQANTTGGADNPLSDGLPEVVRVTNGENHIADVRYAFVINRNCRQSASRVDFQHRKVG